MNELPYLIHYKNKKSNIIQEKVFSSMIIAVLCCILFVFILNTIFTSMYSYVIIRGRSMQPFLNPDAQLVSVDGSSDFYQDAVFIKKTNDIDYNDVIVIDTTLKWDSQKSSIIKRALAFEGDKISIAKIPVGKDANGNYIKEYRFFRIKNDINAEIEILNEDYILSYKDWSDPIKGYSSINIGGIYYEREFYKSFLRYNDTIIKENVEYILPGTDEEISLNMEFATIEKHHVFYMGDNRNNSDDARATGTKDLSRVVGKVVAVIRDTYNQNNDNSWWFEKVKYSIELLFGEIFRAFAPSNI